VIVADDDSIVLVPMPALVAILLHAERTKGTPLTEAEVLRIRDECACVALGTVAAQMMAEKRGYDDIDPENAWEDWQAVRGSLAAAGQGDAGS
jgi:hypothetical protein